MRSRSFSLLPDGTLDLEQDGIAELFEQELDEIHSRQGDASHVSAHDREKLERDSREWQAALEHKCREALASQNISVFSVTRNPDWSFRVHAGDARYTHRDYSVEITLGEAQAVAEIHARAPLEAIARDCVARVLEARATYERRMS